MSDLSSSSEENTVIEDKSETSSRSKIGRSTRGENIRRKFNKWMQFFLAKGGHVLMIMREKEIGRFP